MSETGGHKAVEHGKTHKRKVTDFLKDTLTKTKGARFNFRKITNSDTSPCRNVYGKPRIGMIVTKHVPGYEDGLILEPHMQGSSGSGIDKFDFYCRSIKAGYPYPTILILDLTANLQQSPSVQKGFDDVFEYCKSQVDSRKLVAVMKPFQFEKWFRDQIGYYE